MRKIDITVPRGDDKTLRFALNEGDGPLVTTGLVLSALIKASDEADDATGTDLDVTVENADQGIVTVYVPDSATAVPGIKWWKLYAVNPAQANDRTTIIFGRFTVIPV